jgi:hypothetical protein
MPYVEKLKSRVFVVQEVPGRNLLPIRDWGEPIVVLPAGSQIVFSSAPTVRKVRQALRDFNDEDFIVPIGDPAAIGVVCALAALVNEGRFRMLKWDRQEQTYYEVRIDLGKEKG